MRLIEPNCRMRLTGEDLDFILEVLQPDLGSRDVLQELLLDQDTRDLILDDEKLARAVLERCGCLRISTEFYFYILVRHVLRPCGLTSRRVSDYVARLLSEFSRIERTQLRARPDQPPLEYFCDMLAAMQQVDDTTRFHIRVHMGNSSLFFLGIFPDRIRHRAERRGAPDLDYYERLGRSSYQAARDHRLAEEYHLTDVYDTLAEHFPTARRALNDLGERLVHIGDPEGVRRLPYI